MQVSKDSANISAAIISIQEAQMLSGLESDVLMHLVQEGNIKSRKVGQQLKIYRMSLMSYLAKSVNSNNSFDNRVGATAVDTTTDKLASQSDEIWALKKALTDAKSSLTLVEEKYINECERHLKTKSQLAEKNRQLEEALAQIEILMTHQNGASTSNHTQIQAAPIAHPEAIAISKKESFFKKFFRWLGLA